MDDLGLTEFANKKISELSGGQKRRVSIGIELLSQVPSLSSLLIELYIANYFFTHAASLSEVQSLPSTTIFLKGFEYFITLTVVFTE